MPIAKALPCTFPDPETHPAALAKKLSAFPLVPAAQFRSLGRGLAPPPAPRSAMIALPTGLPCPEHASQPGPAENAPLFPAVISRKAFFAPAAYSAGLQFHCHAILLVGQRNQPSPERRHRARAADHEDVVPSTRIS